MRLPKLTQRRAGRTLIVLLILVILAALGGQWGTARADSIPTIYLGCPNATLAAVVRGSAIYWAPRQGAVVPGLALTGGTWFVCPTFSGNGFVGFLIAPQVQAPVYVKAGTFAGF